MKLRKLAFLTLAAVAVALSGCNTADENTAHRKTTLFGIYTYEPGCYAPTEHDTAALRTDDACGMELPSGDRTQFLWGMFSVQDY